MRQMNALRARKTTCLVIVTMLTALTCASGAQDTKCENSTVQDAWGPAIASQAQSFLDKLKRVVKENNKVEFASFVHYPLRVFDRNHDIKISSPSELISKYPHILTPDVRHAILTQSAQCLFANAQGMMVGNGQLWFQQEASGEMKIVTINLSTSATDH